MRRVPGARGLGIAQADAVVVPDHRRTFAAVRPVAAGGVAVDRKGAPVGLRAGEDVVPVRTVAASVHRLAFLVEAGLLADLAVGVQVLDIFGDLLALRVLPRAEADPVARMLGHLAGGAEVGAPHAPARAGGLGERLAVGVGAFQAAQVRTLAQAGAGDEER